MYKASMVVGAVLIGGMIFLAMFPGLRAAMIGVNTTGWLSLFAVVVRFLPYAVVIIFLMWLLNKAR
jgi:membrane protein implicated in regulation of membrane protease activity